MKLIMVIKTDMRIFLKNFCIFCVGFTIYQCIEGIWKTFVHSNGVESFTMGLIGGTALLLIGLLNKYFKWTQPIWLQVILGGLFIICAEFLTGLIINKWLFPLLNKPVVWDYSDMPGNILGQICPQYSAIWLILSLVCILIDDYLRYKLYNEEKPHYAWWFNNK